MCAGTERHSRWSFWGKAEGTLPWSRSYVCTWSAHLLWQTFFCWHCEHFHLTISETLGTKSFMTLDFAPSSYHSLGHASTPLPALYNTAFELSSNKLRMKMSSSFSVIATCVTPIVLVGRHHFHVVHCFHTKQCTRYKFTMSCTWMNVQFL